MNIRAWFCQGNKILHPFIETIVDADLVVFLHGRSGRSNSTGGQENFLTGPVEEKSSRGVGGSIPTMTTMSVYNDNDDENYDKIVYDRTPAISRW